MADNSKAQKLASARKKFKELKKEKKRNAAQKQDDNNSSMQSSRELTPVEIFETKTEQLEITQLPNYFNGNYVNCPEPAAFFDNFLTSTTTNSAIVDFFNQPNQVEVPSFNENNPKTNQSEMTNFIENPVTIIENPQINDNIDEIKSSDVFIEKQELSSDLLENVETVPHSNIESLKQLSNEMADLIQLNSDNIVPNRESHLELRNQELAGIVEQEKLKNEQLNVLLNEYQMKINELENQIKANELNNDRKYMDELNNLRDELKNHTQTIGILVGENAELQANLNQFKLTTKQKIDECDELQGRLRTSRSRVVDLEREIQTLKNDKLQSDHFDKEIERFKHELNRVKLEKDELNQDLLEAREKLKTSSENNLELQKQINDLNGQLSMANLKIQQLSTGQDDERIERLVQEKFTLEKQMADLNTIVKNLTKERDESNLQYQQYAQQLNNQLTNLAHRLEQVQKENESLQIQEQNRIKHIEELEKQLQNLQNEHISFNSHKPNSDIKIELDKSLDLIQKLQVEINDLTVDNERITAEKDDLIRELESKNNLVKELEEKLVELKENQPDNAKLLAIMESDKIAASRALIQNTELKNQMDSMQEVFYKLNNDKIELTEKLSIEQYNNKELIEKLQRTELNLNKLTDAIEIKDNELSQVRQELYELNKQIINSEQLTDRLRHYEAHDYSSHILQDELKRAQATIIELQNEIDRLKQPKNDDNHDVNELDHKLKELELKNHELETKLNENRHDDSNDKTLDKEAAMKHLEEKFLKTMNEIAVLTEEKQRLEHLVLQLQSETETIDEYVALYQHQRSILKQRAIEKDLQLKQLENDREQMKLKLEQLNNLINKFVINSDDGILNNNENTNINNGIHKNLENSHENHQNNDTAEQIISLLSEIKNSNLVQPSENIHHCPWCSGQLITV